MKKVIFLEGLPGVGKTTIIQYIKKMNRENIRTVDEIINIDIFDNINSNNQDYYMKNDDMKINKFEDGIIIVDRGPISTYSYNQMRKILNQTYDMGEVEKWFNNVKAIFEQKDTKIIYLRSKEKKYYLPYFDNGDPYGSVKNQKKLDKISIDNCKKYCKNFEIKTLFIKRFKELVDEIIS